MLPCWTQSQLRTASSLMETSSLSLDFKTWLSRIQDPVSIQECCHFKGICAVLGMNSKIIFVVYPCSLLIQYLYFSVTNSALTLGGICSGKAREAWVKTLHISWDEVFWRFTTYPTYPFSKGLARKRDMQPFLPPAITDTSPSMGASFRSWRWWWGTTWEKHSCNSWLIDSWLGTPSFFQRFSFGDFYQTDEGRLR